MNREIEEQLRIFYKTSRPTVDAEVKNKALSCIAEVAEQDAAPIVEEHDGFWRFAFGQLRFIRIRTWIMQLALIALLLFISFVGTTTTSIVPAVSCLVMLSVLVCIPEVFRSFDTDVAELEFASRVNCAQVLASRMALFGLADIAWLSVAIFAVPALSGCDAFQVMLFACIPFFLSCGGCFWIVRIRPKNMIASCALLIVLLITATCLAWALNPNWYGLVSSAVWACLFIISIVFAIYEITRVLRDASTGLESFVSFNA